MHLLGEAISKGAKYWSQRPAVIERDAAWTFAEVHQRARQLASSLHRLSGPPHRIGVLLGNRHEYLEIYFAKILAGMAWVTMSTRLSDDELVWQLEDASVTTLIVGAQFVERVEALRGRFTTVTAFVIVGGEADGYRSYETLTETGETDLPTVEAGPDDLVRIAYTGGTTGRPKGIAIPRRSDEAVMRNLLLDNVPDLGPDDVFLGLQPIYHAVWTFILPCWLRGVTQLILDDWTPANVFDWIERKRVTVIKTVPTVLVRLLESPEIADRDLSSLRTIVYGAAPMPIEKLRQGIDRFGPIFVQNYGQAEAPMTIATLSKSDHKLDADGTNPRLSSVGRAYSFVHLRIVDDDGNDVPPGDVGEVAVNSDHVMAGYWNQPPEVTAQSLRDGMVYTRDIGRMDEAGYLYLVDRKNEMIITGGLNVYPNEVEQVLYEHPAVLEAAVIGIPDDDWGESIKAVVALRDDSSPTEQELLDFCASRMARHKRPRSIEFRDSLPKSAAGKILRREVRAPYWADKQRTI